MPDTRPNIRFDEKGVCEGCNYEVKKQSIDWAKRWEELQEFVKNKKTFLSKYDCIIAISGGKDSHFQVHLFKEKLGLNPLLVCISDNMTLTYAGEHNLRNIATEFDCDLLIYKMKPQTQCKIMRYTTEKYGKPLYIIDRLIYTVPVWIAIKNRVPIVVYGENVAVTRGLKDNRDIPEAWNQMRNGVGSDIPIEEIIKECNINEKDLSMTIFLPESCQNITTPIYTSYYVKWDAYSNYQFAKSRGFIDLEGIWDRWGGNLNFWQIDSYGYMCAFDFKFAKLGHSGLTDCVCELIRSGNLTKDKGMQIIKDWERRSDPLAVRDFCKFVGYSELEYFKILNDIKEKYARK
jgi:N-acetyl sugar amidotransferase